MLGFIHEPRSRSWSHVMKLGIAVPHYGPALSDAGALRRFAIEAERLRYDTLWCGDRLFLPGELHGDYPGEDYPAYADRTHRFADPLVVVGALTSVTSNVRFNFSTLNAPLHHPVILARTLTTLDLLSDGRLDAGFGLGWMRDEYDTLGVPWSQRGARLDDLLGFLHAWWTADPVEYEGLGWSFPSSRAGLRPVQPGGPPVYLAGTTTTALTRVGRRASGWLTFDSLPAEVRNAMWATVRRSAEEAGRDPGQLSQAVRVNAEPGESLEHLAGRLTVLAQDGVDEALVDFIFRYDSLQEVLDAAGHLADARGL
jgi:probable F420-dependent oxidoreductase